ncbi:hypothetical protein ACHAWF_012347 [Thalassiosira exigua]
MIMYISSILLLTASSKIRGTFSYELRDPIFFFRDQIAKRYDPDTGTFDPPPDFSQEESSLFDDPDVGAGSIVGFEFGLGYADIPYLLAVAYGDKILMHGMYAGFEHHFNNTCEDGRLSHYGCSEHYTPGNRTTVNEPSHEADFDTRGSQYNSMAYQGGLTANLAHSELISPSSYSSKIIVQSNDNWAPDVGHGLSPGSREEQIIPVQNGVTAMAFEPSSGINTFYLRLMLGMSAQEIPPDRRQLETEVPSARVEVYTSYNWRSEMEKEAEVDLMEGSTAVVSIEYSPNAEFVAITTSLEGGESGLQIFEKSKSLEKLVKEWVFAATPDAPISEWMPPYPVVAWSPDSSRLAIARPDTGKVEVYEPKDGRDWTAGVNDVASLEAGLMFPSTAGVITYDIKVHPAKALAFHQDGSALYVAHDADAFNSTSPAEIRVYSAETWEQIDKYAFDFIDSFKSLKFRLVRSSIDDCCLGITSFSFVDENVKHQLAMSVSKTGLPDFVTVFEVELGPTLVPTLQPSTSPPTAAPAPLNNDATSKGLEIGIYFALAIFTFVVSL